MSMLDEIAKLIDDEPKSPTLAKTLLRKANDATLYVLTVGLEHIKSRQRAKKRREILREIKPKFVPGKTTGSFVFSAATQKLLKERARKFFDVFPLTSKIMLGDATREVLQDRASQELKSGKGHELRADFYLSLAEPLKHGQRVRDVWKPEEALKRYDKLEQAALHL